MPRTLPPARAACEQLRGAAPASRVRAGRGPKTRRRAPFTVPKLTPVIVIDCLRAHGMGKEEFSQLRLCCPASSRNVHATHQGGRTGDFSDCRIGLGYGLRECCSSHPLSDAKTLAVGGGRAGGGGVIVVEVGSSPTCQSAVANEEVSAKWRMAKLARAEGAARLGRRSVRASRSCSPVSR